MFQEKGSSNKPDFLLSFVANSQDIDAVSEATKSLQLEGVGLKKGDIDTAISYLKKNDSPKNLIVDVTKHELCLTKISDLADVCEPGTKVVVVGDRNDVGLYRQLLNMGVADYLVSPVPHELFKRTLLQMGAGSASTVRDSRQGKIICVAGVRGGVGASTLTSAVASNLSRFRKRKVVILDLDLNGGSCGTALGIPPTEQSDRMLTGSDPTDESFVENAIQDVDKRLSIITGFGFDWSKPISINSQKLRFTLDFLSKKYHYVLTCTGFGDFIKHFDTDLNSNSLVIISSLSLSSLKNLYRIESQHHNLLGNNNCLLALNATSSHQMKNLPLIDKLSRKHSQIYRIPYDEDIANDHHQFKNQIGKKDYRIVINTMSDHFSGRNIRLS